MRKFPSLNALHTFEVAARNLSFSAAAEELNVTQAAVSRQIRALENDLGVQLFHRLTRAVELTEEGEFLYPTLSDAFYQIENATARIWGNKGSGVLTISVLPTFSVKWLMPRLMDFSDLNPNVEVRLINSIKPIDFEREEVDLAIRVGNTSLLSDSSAKPRIDLTITRSWEGLQVAELMDDELVAVASPAYAAEFGEVHREQDLAGMTLLHMATRQNAWADFFRALGWSGSAAEDGHAYGHFFMSIQAAYEGRGIALVPEVLVGSDLKSGNLVKMIPETVLSAGRYYLVGRKRTWQQQKVRTFRRWLLAEVQKG